MTGMTLGLLLGAPVGGALYGAFGFRGPFIFGIIITVLDLIGRLLIIERKNALRYGYDPTLKMVHEKEKEADVEDGTAPTKAEKAVEGAAAQAMPAVAGAPAIAPEEVVAEQAEGKTGAARAPPAKIGILRASVLLAKSPRAMAAYLNTFAMGYVALLPLREPSLTNEFIVWC
jgi:DHA1 family solute carrier family 18 vesicular amine transporter 1/2